MYDDADERCKSSIIGEHTYFMKVRRAIDAAGGKFLAGAGVEDITAHRQMEKPPPLMPSAIHRCAVLQPKSPAFHASSAELSSCSPLVSPRKNNIAIGRLREAERARRCCFHYAFSSRFPGKAPSLLLIFMPCAPSPRHELIILPRFSSLRRSSCSRHCLLPRSRQPAGFRRHAAARPSFPHTQARSRRRAMPSDATRPTADAALRQDRP